MVPPKKEKIYIDKKRAKLCQILIRSAILIIVFTIIIHTYLSFLIPEEDVLTFLGFQSPIQWILIIITVTGTVMALLGLRMVVRGALEEVTREQNQLTKKY